MGYSDEDFVPSLQGRIRVADAIINGGHAASGFVEVRCQLHIRSVVGVVDVESAGRDQDFFFGDIEIVGHGRFLCAGSV